MRRNILYIAFASAVLAAAALTSCNENELDPKKAGEGKKISFSISDAGTRTEYDSDDNLQINWTEGDKVRIYCNEAEDVKNADYTVAQISKNSGKLVYNESGLAWGGDDLVHNFYAVYPADKKIIAGVDGGKVTVNANLNQMCTLGAKDANGMYNTIPDMSNAVMVANLSTTPVDEVALSFKPIMTTIEVVVRGYENENLGVDITGISISMDASAYGASSKQFVYDIKEGDIVRGDINSTVQFFVGVKGSTGDNIVHLTKGESVKITAFLPPVTVNDAHKIKIRVHATGATELVATIGGNDLENGAKYEIAQSSKRRITLPWIIEAEEYNKNNWITLLDDKIYVSQLSIPGTHDAGTGEGMDFKNSMTVLSAIGDLLNNIGVTQYYNIEQQLLMGIRAFDFRPAYNTKHKAMYLWHGLACTKQSLNGAFDKLISYLNDNPGEFVIVQMRKENENAGILTAKDNDVWESEMLSSLTRIKEANGNYRGIAQWKPDLTIEECRGKIIILTRNEYNSRSLGGLVNNFPENSICGWFSDNDEIGKETIVDKDKIVSTTNDNNEYIDRTKTTTISVGNYSTPYYVQDYYKTGSDNGTTKIALIKSMLKATATFCINREKQNYWALNHTSGYTGSLSRTSDYQNNAHNVNPAIYNYINSSDYTPGPMGIIFMDFVGSRNSDEIVVYGDLLPQAIIDNNYKYHMLRQGE